MALQERELQIQKVSLELSEQISSLESKADENLEIIGKLKRELKVLNMHVYMTLCILIIVNRMKSPSHQITKSG